MCPSEALKTSAEPVPTPHKTVQPHTHTHTSLSPGSYLQMANKRVNTRKKLKFHDRVQDELPQQNMGAWQTMYQVTGKFMPGFTHLQIG